MLLEKFRQKKNVANVIEKNHFKTKVTQFTNVFMYNYVIKMLRKKIEETNVSSSNEYKVSNTMHLYQIISLSARAPLREMAHKNVNIFSTEKEMYQSQVACVSYLNFKKTRHPRRKLIIVCTINLMLELHNKLRKHRNKTIPVSLLVSCSTIIGSHSFSRGWVLFYINSLKNMCVLIILFFKDDQKFLHNTEDLNIPHLMSSQ